MPASSTALLGFGHCVDLWRVDQASAADIVYAACDVLAAGTDGVTLAELAAVEIGAADTEVHVLLPAVLGELGLPVHETGSDAAEHAGLIAMAARAVVGTVTPRDLAAWAHHRCGHVGIEAARRLADLDDVYEVNVPLGDPVESVDADALAEARRIVAEETL